MNVLTISIPAPNDPTIGGIINIPFLEENAKPRKFEAIFWIETVKQADPMFPLFMKLQYAQRIILRFNDIDWPHISVATLMKQ